MNTNHHYYYFDLYYNLTLLIYSLKRKTLPYLTYNNSLPLFIYNNENV